MSHDSAIPADLLEGGVRDEPVSEDRAKRVFGSRTAYRALVGQPINQLAVEPAPVVTVVHVPASHRRHSSTFGAFDGATRLTGESVLGCAAGEDDSAS